VLARWTPDEKFRARYSTDKRFTVMSHLPKSMGSVAFSAPMSTVRVEDQSHFGGVSTTGDNPVAMFLQERPRRPPLQSGGSSLKSALSSLILATPEGTFLGGTMRATTSFTAGYIESHQLITHLVNDI